MTAMYIKIHKTKGYVGGNKQSCRDLVNYLEKENKDKIFSNKEPFFSHGSGSIDPQYVINSIDNNKKGLKDKDAKFFMLTINPSEYELKHLAFLATGRKDISHISQMKPKELDKYNNLLKGYTRKVMEEYAASFDRGLSGKDLVYYAKLEQERHYKGTDKEVKQGKVQSGDLKPGLQSHVHIVISRKDVNQKYSLSPLANSRGSNKHKLNGKSVKVGFNRDSFFQSCETTFDKEFNYSRNYEKHYQYYKTIKHVTQTANYLDNPERATSNMVLHSIDKLSGTRIATNLNKVSGAIQNPESSKGLLIHKLEKILDKTLPPQLRIAKKVIQKVIDLGKGIE